MKISLSLQQNGHGTEQKDSLGFIPKGVVPSAASLAVEQQQFCTWASYPRTASLGLWTSRVWCGVKILDVRTYLVGGTFEMLHTGVVSG